MSSRGISVFVVVLAVVGLAVFSLFAVGTDAESTVKDGVLVHITAGPEAPHRLLMGLQMAVKMAESRPVTVYLDIDGVLVALADTPNLSFAEFPSSDTQLEKLIKKGVTVMACPGCLAAAGKKPSDLREGIKMADQESFFAFTDGRIVTLDY